MHGARCARAASHQEMHVPAGLYQYRYRCMNFVACTVLVECAHLHESDLSTFDLKLQYWYHRTSTIGSYQLSCTSSA